MNLEALLLDGFSAETLKYLNELVKGDCDGWLGDDKFDVCSIKGSGRRAFVVKGWVRENEGPTVRFRAAWGELSDAEIQYQPTVHDKWQETDTNDVQIERDSKNLTITATFSMDDDVDHVVKFSKSIV